MGILVLFTVDLFPHPEPQQHRQDDRDQQTGCQGEIK